MGRVDNQSIGFTRETSQEKVICYVREEVFFSFYRNRKRGNSVDIYYLVCDQFSG